MKPRGTLTEPMFYVLMSFLHREMCGMEITEFVEKKTNGRVRLGPGTLYTLLGKFLEERLIEETQTDGRKRSYRITEAGRAAFAEELARLSFQFHCRIAHASGNPIYPIFLCSMRSTYEILLTRYYQQGISPGEMTVLHTALYDAILSGRPKAAQKAMMNILTYRV